jgi:DNA-binding GntR family transcriptional regulator
LIEGHITERATPNITAARLAELRSMEDAMRRGRDNLTWLRLNSEFHHEILKAASDKTGLELVGQLQSRVERCVHMWRGEKNRHVPSAAGMEHAQILDCVADGNAAGPRQAVEQHIRNSGRRLIAYGAAVRKARGAGT